MLHQSEHPLAIQMLHRREEASKEVLTLRNVSIPQPPAILEGPISKPTHGSVHMCVTSVCAKFEPSRTNPGRKKRQN